MQTLLAVLAIPAALVVVGLLFWRKILVDAVRQNGARVGSALPAEYPAPGAAECRFAIIRGEPAFREEEPFDFRGITYLMVAHEHLNTGSTVLRRWENAVCQVLARKPGR